MDKKIKRKRVIFVIDSFTTPNAGTEGQLYSLINGLDKVRLDVKLIILNRARMCDLSGLNCDVSFLPSFSISKLSNWYVLFKKLKVLNDAETKSIVHTFFNDASVVCPIICKLLGIKCVISRRDMGFWYSQKLLFLLRISSLFVEKVVANSQAVKMITHTKEGYDLEKIKVIYNSYSFDCNTLCTAVPVLSQLENNDHFNVVLVANLRPIKRIKDAIAAISQIPCDNLRLFIIGGGEQKEYLNFASAARVQHRVYFLGSRSDVKELLPHFDLGILCSESEGFSNSILEYQMASLPVICSATGGNVEAVNNSVDGFLYPVGDIDELVNKLKSLYADKELCERMGKAGFDKVIHRHSKDIIHEQYLSMYEQII